MQIYSVGHERFSHLVYVPEKILFMNQDIAMALHQEAALSCTATVYPNAWFHKIPLFSTHAFQLAQWVQVFSCTS